MPRVLVSDKLEPAGLDLLREAGIELDERHGLSGPALQDALRGAKSVGIALLPSADGGYAGSCAETRLSRMGTIV